MRADTLAALLPYLTPSERAEVEAIQAADTAVWRAQPGPQLQVLSSDADIIGFGGSAGGGKSDLLCGMVLTEHTRSVIFRREKAQTERIAQRLTELLGSTAGYNSQKGIWQLGGGALLELAGLDNPGDERRWQGRDHDLKAYDEVTEMREDQVRFTMGWARTSDRNQRVRVLMTFNPPTTVEGRWVIKFFAPWLDDKHVNRAEPGELRWFTTIGDDKDYEVPDGRPFVLDGAERIYDFDPAAYRGARATRIIKPRSRTFIPSRVTDNPYYMATDYIATLQTMPEPLRSQMLNGDFAAGVEDDPWQLIPTAWVDAAMDRWRPRDQMQRPVGPMDSIGADVAAGGRDKEVLSRRHGHWFDDLIVQNGEAQPDGAMTGSRVIAIRRDQAVVHVDVVGPGGPTHGFLSANNIQSVGVNGADRSLRRSIDGALPFFNLRSDIWWGMREALDPARSEPCYLPDDTALRADLTAPKWSYQAGGIRVESKIETKKRLGRSPDRGDAVVYANITTMKLALHRKLVAAVTEYDRYKDL